MRCRLNRKLDCILAFNRKLSAGGFQDLEYMPREFKASMFLQMKVGLCVGLCT